MSFRNVRNYTKQEVIEMVGKEVVYKENRYEITHVEIHPFYYKVFLWNLKDDSDRVALQENKAKTFIFWPDGSPFGVKEKAN